MKNNNDLEFIKNKIENENIQPPEKLDANAVKGIIYPQTPKRISFTKTKPFISAVAAVFVLVIAVASAIITENIYSVRTDNPSASDDALPSFQSYNQLYKTVSKAQKKNHGFLFYNEVEEKAVGSAADGEVTGAASSSHSETNVQVDGVDEGDIIKNDGRYIYYCAAGTNEIKIYKPDGDKAEEISSISEYKAKRYEHYAYEQLAQNTIISDFYICGDRLVLNANSYSTEDYEEFTLTEIYDLSDIENPEKLNEFVQSGYYTTSRLIGTQLYIVSQHSTLYKNSKTPEDYAPKCGVSGEAEPLPIEDIKYIEDSENSTFVVVSGIDVQKSEKTASTKAVYGTSDDIYCNENNMYLTSYVDYEDMETEIVKVTLKRDEIRFANVALFEGSVNNQFSMDEFNGNLRVAVTCFDYSDGDNDTNRIYIFNDELDEIGRVSDFAKGESIKSVRFVKNTAYVITYKQIDPLFVIDLSDAKNPEILGEVEITGFSSQLIPVDENTVLGIGYSTKPSEASDLEATDGLKLALFDVSNAAEPKVLDFAEIDGVYSSAQTDHKAIAIDRENSRYAVDFYSSSNDTDSSGVISFEVTPTAISNVKIRSQSGDDSSFMNRCTFFGDYIYSFDYYGEVTAIKY